MRYDHAIAHLKFRSARFHHPAGYFMTQDNGVFHSLKTNLVNMEKQTPQAVTWRSISPSLSKGREISCTRNPLS